ncbi:DNA-binding response regulator [Enterococcus florum]|uniref:DNA-binding response regulator n=1 Tax=Enterococcus florum TaxID=2480627 RepID=A0A4P5P5Q2_9ENTE|nr:LytTR family DNA-binding domain-containing protein [Enterococcus florum]GCF93187.1 DNA-binding response regulator [Enterococcus florum]
MKKVYICDDERIYREQINALIQQIIEEKNYPLTVALKAQSAQELLQQSIDHTSSIYFLDINLVGSSINGFELGKEIRHRDPFASIVFVTTFEELAFETFKYRLEALDYIVKDQPETISGRIGLCLASVMEKAAATSSEKASNEGLLKVKFGDELVRIPFSEIIFVETSSKSHRVVVHTINQVVEITHKLANLEKELSDSFIRCHRSFLVNQNYIRQFNLNKGMLELTTGELCLVSRRMKKLLKEKYF